MENNNLSRVNIRVSQKIKKYFVDKSVETGVSQSALIALALEEYIDLKQSMNFMSNQDVIHLLKSNAK